MLQPLAWTLFTAWTLKITDNSDFLYPWHIFFFAAVIHKHKPSFVLKKKKKKIPLNMEALLKPWTATKQFTHKTRSLLPPLSINVKTGTKHHLYCKAAVLGSQWKTTTHPWNELFLPGATWLTLSFLLPQCANNELNVSQPGTIVWT